MARRLPILLAQLFNHLNGMKYVLSVMLLATLFSRYPASRSLITGWLVAVAIITLARLGSRTELVLLILSATMMYDTLLGPIRPRLVMTVAACGLIGFVAFGAVRNGINITDDGGVINPFSYATEFESLFANAVHLDRERPTLEKLPTAFYLADVAAIHPAAARPYTKIDRADWYVNKFFPEYAQAGGGLAFGTISESVLIGGWLSALAAGAALGFCFAKSTAFISGIWRLLGLRAVRLGHDAELSVVPQQHICAPAAIFLSIRAGSDLCERARSAAPAGDASHEAAVLSECDSVELVSKPSAARPGG